LPTASSHNQVLLNQKAFQRVHNHEIDQGSGPVIFGGPKIRIKLIIRAQSGIITQDRGLIMRPIQQFAKAISLTVLVFTAQMLAADKSWAQNERCGGFQSISLTDWEAGLGAWTAGTYDLAQPGAFETPDWAAVGDLPDGKAGRAAFAANLDVGTCPGNDQSGVLTLTSPTIDIPAETDTLKIALNHWFDIEYGWDGGNLKISVNEGPFTLVPGSAFETGPYTDVLFEAIRDFSPYNLNPLAEQEAFTGPGLDLEGGSWGVSRVNLAGIAAAGDSIQLRFDFGIDECLGAVGWYVDDVEVYSCGETDGASLTLVNEVINDNGGTARASAWSLTADGPTSFSGRGPSISSGASFVAGTYDLSESEGASGYTASEWSCLGGTQVDGDTITLGTGEQATCTITNDDIAPSLMLVNEVVNDDGGMAMPSDWMLHASGPVSFSGQGPSVTSGEDFVAGSYDLSQSGGPEGYLAGAWMCDGGLQMDRDTVVLGLGEEVNCTVINLDIDPDFAISVGHAGSWYYPLTSGQGQFIDIEPASQFMFIGWFTFTDADSERPGEQQWYTAQGNYAGNVAALDLYETLGGKFDDPQTVETTRVGEVTLTFADCEVGSMDYRFDSDGREGTVPMVRTIPGSENFCQRRSEPSTLAVDINDGMDGGWFNPPTSGQGFYFDVYTNAEGLKFIFISWFTYGNDTASGLRWLTAQGPYEGSVAEIDINETTGGLFDNEMEVTTVKVGTMTIDFADCETATLSYTLDDDNLEGDIDITRAVPGGQALCEQLDTGE